MGRTVAALAADRGVEPAAAMLDLCADHGNELQVVLASRRADDVATFLAHPLATLGSDGSALPLDIGADVRHTHGATVPTPVCSATTRCTSGSSRSRTRWPR